jgi:recombination protein RecA
VVATDKERAVGEAIKGLEKQYEPGVVFWMSDAPLHVEAISTGSIALDRALGIGGVPRGKLTEVFGKESAGKTTLVQHIIAEAQRNGGLAALIDAEHALDRAYAEACGVDVDRLVISQPDYGEQALDVAEALIKSGGIDVLVLDSVAALVPRAELEGEMGDQQVGLQARLMGKACRKLGGVVYKTNTALVFVNQLREKVGGFAPHGIVPEVTPGGRALKFHAAVRLDIRRVEDIKEGKESVGITSRVKVVKNKCAPPFKECLIDILFGQGIDRASGLLEVGTETGVVKKAGAWLSWGEYRWNGRDEAKRFLRANAEVLQGIDTAIRGVAA